MLTFSKFLIHFAHSVYHQTSQKEGKHLLPLLFHIPFALSLTLIWVLHLPSHQHHPLKGH